MLCGRCFRDISNNQICPYCAFDAGEEVKKRRESSALPLMYRLKDYYLLGELLGAGGFGLTYLAYDRSKAETVAIKEFFPGKICRRSQDYTVVPTRSEDVYNKSVQMFYEEAKTLFKLNGCPSVVNVRGFFRANNTAYLVMEYVEGQSLKDFCRDNMGHVPLERAKNIIVQVALALSEVHAMGIIHSDISPSNILIAPDGDIKLIDFGASRSFISKEEVEFQIQLKPSYAPPEQYGDNKGRIGPWTDIYALACTFVKMISGESVPPAPERQKGAALPDLSEWLGNDREKILAALTRALELDAQKRYSDIDCFISDFSDYVENDTRTAAEQPAEKILSKIKKTILDHVKQAEINFSSRQVYGVIEVVQGKNSGTRLKLESGKQYFIGRQADMCDLVVSDKSVISRVHCVVSFDAAEKALTVYDKSSNGVFLETGQALNKGKAVIRSDMLIVLANGEAVLSFTLNKNKG